MSTIMSFSVDNGDMFSIEHDSDNFTIIDCCLKGEEGNRILEQVAEISENKGITRFITTHPDKDHITGLVELDDQIRILNFYCVKNNAKKEETDDFERYCTLKDHSRKAFHISAGCSRRWMNQSDEDRDSSGIEILWPVRGNEHFQIALKQAESGESPNNISPIIQYSKEKSVTALWMGDLEADFMESIKDAIELPKTDILFAPHHGRDSGKVPSAMLDEMKPKIIIIGEAKSEHINYYDGYNTITQNSAKNIAFKCLEGKVRIFASNKNYSVSFLPQEEGFSGNSYYVGTLHL